MLIQLLFVYILIIPPVVYSQCYSNSSQTLICNNHYTSNITEITTFDFETVLNNQPYENLFLQNYQFSIFKIDNYPSTLRLLNASHNQFETIIITSKNRYLSNLRQLILQSNNIKQFSIKTITLPQSIEIISLANNRLEVLDARIFLRLKNLTQLDLTNNLLKYILPQLLLNTKINLDNNPLDCQCTPDFYRIICEKSTNLQPSIVRKIL
jgi:Leucine-rich repeat (LRR) protein